MNMEPVDLMNNLSLQDHATTSNGHDDNNTNGTDKLSSSGYSEPLVSLPSPTAAPASGSTTGLSSTPFDVFVSPPPASTTGATSAFAMDQSLASLELSAHPPTSANATVPLASEVMHPTPSHPTVDVPFEAEHVPVKGKTKPSTAIKHPTRPTAQTASSKAKIIKKPVASSSKKAPHSPKSAKLHHVTAIPAAPRSSKSKSGVMPPPAPVVAPPSSSSEPADAPTTAAGNKKKLTAEEASRFASRMHDAAKEYARRREEKRKELESKYKFVPKVNKAKATHADSAKAPASSSSITSTANIPGGGANGTETKDPSAQPPPAPQHMDRFQRLHEQAKESQKKKEELRARGGTPEYSFKPQITAKAKKLSAKKLKGDATGKPHYENLYKQAEALRQKREEKKLEQENKEIAGFTFKPKISTSKSPVKPRQLYDMEREKQKRLELEQKRLAAEISECTFKPKVSSASSKPKAKDTNDLNPKSGGSSAAFDRLYHAGQEKQQKLERLRHEYEEKEKLLIPFQPQISSSSAHSNLIKQPFHERLFAKDHLQKTVAEREARKLEEESKFTFKPTISDVPEEIKSKGGSDGKEESKEQKSIFDRLYEEKDRVKEKIEQSEEIKKQREMEGCTFKPQIAVEEVNIALSGQPVWERLAAIDKNQVIEEREKLKEQLELQQCTFKPEISPMEGSNSPKRSPSWLANSFEQMSGSDAGFSTEQRGRVSPYSSSDRALSRNKSLSSMKETRVAIDQILKSSKLVLTLDPTPTSSQAKSLPKSMTAGPGEMEVDVVNWKNT